MALTNSSYCDFFVYTKYGYHLERIKLNQNFWMRIVENLKWFWFNCVAPALITMDKAAVPKTTQNVQDNSSIEDKIVMSNKINNDTPKYKDKSVAASIKKQKVVAVCNTKSKTKISKKKPKKLTNKKKRKIVNLINDSYKCGKCQKVLIDNPKYFEDESIGCELCSLWFHFTCAGIKNGKQPKQEDSWKCPKCEIKNC